MMDGWSMNSMMMLMFLAGLLLIAFIIFVVVLLMKWLSGSRLRSSATERDGALKVLKIRYAKGKIGHEEFESMRRDIEK